MNFYNPMNENLYITAVKAKAEILQKVIPVSWVESGDRFYMRYDEETEKALKNWDTFIVSVLEKDEEEKLPRGLRD
jgi:hypothetical protein